MRRKALLMACLLGLLAACERRPEDSAADAVHERLVDTWLRAYHQAGTQVRRVLVLETDGSFREQSSVLSADSSVGGR